jgi:hypothetical protein
LLLTRAILRRCAVAAAALAAALCGTSVANAEPSYPSMYFAYPAPTCSDCHTQAPALTSFGTAWQNGCWRTAWGDPSCAAVASADSDGDGFTNAEEIALGTNPAVAGDVNECARYLAKCNAYATCANDGPARGDYSCVCPSTGFSSSGSGKDTTCTDVDECQTNNGGCAAHSTCKNTVGSYQCPCDASYFGDGKTAGGCTFVDPCAGWDCSSGLTACIPMNGNATCGPCPAGYMQNGMYANCVDVNECLTNNGGCDPLTTCTNTPGGRTCGACPAGMLGDGVSGCKMPHCDPGLCGTYATCAAGTTGAGCACVGGFSGGGATCTDVNECANNPCGSGSSCGNLPGTFICSCSASAAFSPLPPPGGSSSRRDDPPRPWPLAISMVAVALLLLQAARRRPWMRPIAAVVAVWGLAVACGSGSGGSAGNRMTGGGGTGAAGHVSSSGSAGASAGASGAAGASSGGTASADASAGSSGGTAAANAGSGGVLGNDAGGASGSSTDGGGASGMAGSAHGGAGTGGSGSGAGADGGTDTGGGTGGGGTPGCKRSCECPSSQWCNPATSACESRTLSTPIDFLDVQKILARNYCLNCHDTNLPGAVDPRNTGKPAIFAGDSDVAYLDITAEGVGCGAGQKRVCVDEPASALLATQTLATPGNVGKPSVTFTSWSDPDLQQILKWMASGAPRVKPGSRCGNHVVETGEDCDEGPTPTTSCPYGTATCTLCNAQCKHVQGKGAVCGDGKVDQGYEVCDDGNTTIEEVGTNGGPTCGPSCTYVAGKACGGRAQPCCQTGTACGADLACTDGMCQATCGYDGLPCCSHPVSGRSDGCRDGSFCDTYGQYYFPANTCQSCSQRGTWELSTGATALVNQTTVAPDPTSTPACQSVKTTTPQHAYFGGLVIDFVAYGNCKFEAVSPYGGSFFETVPWCNYGGGYSQVSGEQNAGDLAMAMTMCPPDWANKVSSSTDGQGTLDFQINVYFNDGVGSPDPTDIQLSIECDAKWASDVSVCSASQETHTYTYTDLGSITCP